MNDLYWHCLKCGAHDPVEPTDESALGDSEKCITCGDGMAHVVTTRTGAKYEQGRALGLDIDTAWSRATAPDLDAWALASARRADAMAAEVETLRRERDEAVLREKSTADRLNASVAELVAEVERILTVLDAAVCRVNAAEAERDEAIRASDHFGSTTASVIADRDTALGLLWRVLDETRSASDLGPEIAALLSKFDRKLHGGK